ncbi:unnamed protein product [Closterium sp. Naga37s-1]|nr:unnamed protein product [Closterium sp. Naga37s-1]
MSWHGQQMRAVEERSRVEKDELRREMTEQQQRMQKVRHHTACSTSHTAPYSTAFNIHTLTALTVSFLHHPPSTIPLTHFLLRPLTRIPCLSHIPPPPFLSPTPSHHPTDPRGRAGVRGEQELESAAGREERMRRQLMEAQEGIAHRDAFLQQLQEEAALSASALKQAARVGGLGGKG